MLALFLYIVAILLAILATVGFSKYNLLAAAVGVLAAAELATHVAI